MPLRKIFCGWFRDSFPPHDACLQKCLSHVKPVFLQSKQDFFTIAVAVPAESNKVSDQVVNPALFVEHVPVLISQRDELEPVVSWWMWLRHSGVPIRLCCQLLAEAHFVHLKRVVLVQTATNSKQEMMRHVKPPFNLCLVDHVGSLIEIVFIGFFGVKWFPEVVIVINVTFIKLSVSNADYKT